ADLLDGVGGIDRDLVIGLVAVFHPQVEIHQVDVKERVDQLVLDVLPDDPGHLVAIEFDDGVGHLDFCHDGGGLFGKPRGDAGLVYYSRDIAVQTGWRKPSRHAVSAQFLGLSAAWRPRFDDHVSQRPGRDTKGRQYAPVCGFALFVIVDLSERRVSGTSLPIKPNRGFDRTFGNATKPVVWLENSGR